MKNESVPLNYEDPYSELLVKINEALLEADLHNQQMSEPEYEMFTAIRDTINSKDPDFMI